MPKLFWLLTQWLYRSVTAHVPTLARYGPVVVSCLVTNFAINQLTLWINYNITT